MSDALNLPLDMIDEGLTIENCENWDSLSHVQIIHECETALGVRFTLNEISNLNTIGDLINLINKKS